MTIRPYQEKDKADVRYICLNSDGPCDTDADGQHFLLTTYCDYFIEKEADNCFVCVDENDRAVGYILCAEDFDRFWNCFLAEYLPRINKSNAEHRGYALASAELQQKNKEQYPAHLHVDLLPDYQHMGIGRRLMDTLMAHLKAKGVRAVMLSMWVGNENARRFYEKYGFNCIDKNENNYAYGMLL